MPVSLQSKCNTGEVFNSNVNRCSDKTYSELRLHEIPTVMAMPIKPRTNTHDCCLLESIESDFTNGRGYSPRYL